MRMAGVLWNPGDQFGPHAEEPLRLSFETAASRPPQDEAQGRLEAAAELTTRKVYQGAVANVRGASHVRSTHAPVPSDRHGCVLRGLWRRRRRPGMGGA